MNPMTEHIDPSPYDPGRFLEDLRTTAEAIQALKRALGLAPEGQRPAIAALLRKYAKD